MTALQLSSLNKRVNYAEFGIVTKREFLELAKAQGWTIQVRELDGYSNGDFNRSHYNKLAGEAQTAYENKMKEKKAVYSIHPPTGNSFYDITKTEYEYFNSL